MPKTNFTKVEATTEKELKTREIRRLIDTTRPGQEDKPLSPKSYLIFSLRRDIKLLKGHFRLLKEETAISKKELIALVAKPQSLKPADWQLLESFKQKIDAFKKKVLPDLPSKSDEDLIENQKEKHINKRFNVSDKWLPLH